MSRTSLSAMTSMSKVIREETQRHAPTLKEIPTDVLADLAMIVGAFAADLRDELQRRNEHSPESEA